MTDPRSRLCPSCFQELAAQASRCHHCTQRLPDAPGLHRDLPGRLAGGVCAALAWHFNWDVTLMRVLFVASLAFTGGFALWVYVAMWLMTPFEAGGRPPLGRAVDWLGRLFSPPQGQPRSMTHVDGDRVA